MFYQFYFGETNETKRNRRWKVWLLVSVEAYQQRFVHGIYTSKALATKDIPKFEQSYRSSSRTTYVVEAKLNEFNEYNWSDK